MARGRFISKSITADRQVNQLSSDTCRLAFTWLLTFADCEGRVSGEPDLLVSALFPRRHDVTSAHLEAFIQEWAACGFVVWYLAPDGDRYLQFLNFAKHQLGLRRTKNPLAAFLISGLPNPCWLSSIRLADTFLCSSARFPLNFRLSSAKLKMKLNQS